MSVKRRLFIAVLCVAMAIVAIVPVQSASATTVYDDLTAWDGELRVIPGRHVGNTPPGMYWDLHSGVRTDTANQYYMPQAIDEHCSASIAQSYRDVVANDGIRAFVQSVNGYSGEPYYIMYWTEATQIAPAEFSTTAYTVSGHTWWTDRLNADPTVTWYAAEFRTKTKYSKFDGFQARCYGLPSNAAYLYFRIRGDSSQAGTTSSSIDGYMNRVVYSKNIPVNYPAGYEGEQLPDTYTPPPANYVAMGDSFSSGEGNPPFESGTDEGGENECHRSSEAYPRLLEDDPNLDLNLGSTGFVACSGATTANVLNGGLSTGAWGEPAQVNALTEHVDVATITIGGNDLGFGDIIRACADNTQIPTGYLTHEDYCRAKRQEAWVKLLNPAFETQLALTILAIQTRIEPDAKVIVIGYPVILPTTAVVCTWAPTWAELFPGRTWRSITMEEREDFYDLTIELNRQLESATAAVGLNAQYVDIVDEFWGHAVCQSDPWLHNTHAIEQEYTYHPNESGQLAYKNLIDDYIS